MKFKPMAAFGSVVVVATADAGDTREVALDENGVTSSGNYFYTHGSVAVTVKETGEVLENRTPGWLNTEHPSSGAATTGTLLLTFSEPTEWLCIPHAHNKQGLPKVSSLVVTLGESITLNVGSDLYLVRGEFEINSRRFTGPTQIRIRSGAVTATNVSTGTNYALLFK